METRTGKNHAESTNSETEHYDERSTRDPPPSFYSSKREVCYNLIKYSPFVEIFALISEVVMEKVHLNPILSDSPTIYVCMWTIVHVTLIPLINSIDALFSPFFFP